jgi:hypothetical protein
MKMSTFSRGSATNQSRIKEQTANNKSIEKERDTAYQGPG